MYTNIFREKKESFKVRVPLFAWGCIWCIDTVTLSQDALYIAQSAAVTLHPQILSPASSIMVTSQGNAGSIDTQGVSDLDLAHTLSILVLKWWDFSLSLIIFKQERYLVLHLAQSGLSQHLLDAHRMERERDKSFVIKPQTWRSDNDSQHLSTANCWAVSWPHTVREGRMGEGRWCEAERGWENASHNNYITTSVASFIPFTSNTSDSSISWLVNSFSPVLLFFHFPTSVSFLLATMLHILKRTKGSIHTKNKIAQFSFGWLAAVSVTRR